MEHNVPKILLDVDPKGGPWKAMMKLFVRKDYRRRTGVVGFDAGDRIKNRLYSSSRSENIKNGQPTCAHHHHPNTQSSPFYFSIHICYHSISPL